MYLGCTCLGCIEKIINFAARVVSGRRKYDHVADVREALGWLSASDLAAHDTLVFLHKVICKEEPAAIAQIFQRNEERRERSTRQDSKFSLPRNRTEAGKRRFGYRAAMLYNSLPVEVKSATSKHFILSLKLHLKQ